MTASADPTSNAYLGIDFGTSGLKVTLLGSEGSVLRQSEASYQVAAPAPGHAETHPGEWATALDDALMRTLGGGGAAVAAIGVTGQMHGVVLVDRDGEPVRPALLWPDSRATSVLPRWRELAPAVRAGLANPLAPGMAGPLLTWLSEHEPSALAATALVSSPKDWVRGRLTGDRSTERSDASATLLWDVGADEWSVPAVELAGISTGVLPDVVNSDACVGSVRSGAGHGDQLTGTPVVAGAGDTAAALTALRSGWESTTANVPWADVRVVNAGTGIQIVRPGATAGPRTDPQTHLYADADGGWYDMLAIQNGGLALSWVQGVLGQSWDAFVAAATGADPGSRGAVFTPTLTPERAALAGLGATGGWTGLTPSVGTPELARSAFEAFAFTIRRGIELVDADRASAEGSDRPVLLSGGGSREPWVRQLVADTLGQSIQSVALRSASAVGAAVLAARGVGVTLPVPAETATVSPDPARSAALDAAYTHWLDATALTTNPL